jgi:hypothetical protein
MQKKDFTAPHPIPLALGEGWGEGAFPDRNQKTNCFLKTFMAIEKGFKNE